MEIPTRLGVHTGARRETYHVDRRAASARDKTDGRRIQSFSSLEPGYPKRAPMNRFMSPRVEPS